MQIWVASYGWGYLKALKFFLKDYQKVIPGIPHLHAKVLQFGRGSLTLQERNNFKALSEKQLEDGKTVLYSEDIMNCLLHHLIMVGILFSLLLIIFFCITYCLLVYQLIILSPRSHSQRRHSIFDLMYKAYRKIRKEILSQMDLADEVGFLNMFLMSQAEREQRRHRIRQLRIERRNNLRIL
mmetsp:Transcript_5605/g.9653  ORF Transcript_5605/g.9653 Transcript_5605/m.9653 type:complete len:182 (+) Transcript_5605:488-1033(+)